MIYYVGTLTNTYYYEFYILNTKLCLKMFKLRIIYIYIMKYYNLKVIIYVYPES